MQRGKNKIKVIKYVGLLTLSLCVTFSCSKNTQLLSINGDTNNSDANNSDTNYILFDTLGGIISGRSSVKVKNTDTWKSIKDSGILPTASKEDSPLKGWSIDSNTYTEPSDTQTFTQNITLYAFYQCHDYTVTFNAGAGRFSDYSKVKTFTNRGYIYSGDLCEIVPPVDQTFLGYKVNGAGSIISFPYKITKSENLVATYSDNEKIVFLDYGIGTKDNEHYAVITGFKKGDILNKSDLDTYKPTLPSNVFFKEWANTNGEPFFIGDTYTINDNVVIKVNYNYQISVSFDVADAAGHWKDGSIGNKVAEFGASSNPYATTKTTFLDAINLADSAKTYFEPYKNGHSFVGWFDGTGEDAKKCENSDLIIDAKDPKTSLTFYARFEQREYDITFVDEDGITPLYKIRIPYGKIPTFGGTMPTKEGQIFKCWDPMIEPASKDMVYKAIFATKCKVTLDLNYCELSNSEEYKEFYPKGGEVSFHINEAYSIHGMDIDKVLVEVKDDGGEPITSGYVYENNEFRMTNLPSNITIKIMPTVSYSNIKYTIQDGPIVTYLNFTGEDVVVTDTNNAEIVNVSSTKKKITLKNCSTDQTLTIANAKTFYFSPSEDSNDNAKLWIKNIYVSNNINNFNHSNVFDIYSPISTDGYIDDFVMISSNINSIADNAFANLFNNSSISSHEFHIYVDLTEEEARNRFAGGTSSWTTRVGISSVYANKIVYLQS